MICMDGYSFCFDENACNRCDAACCKGEGYVFVDNDDIRRISAYLGIDPEEFERLYVRCVLYGKRKSIISLKTGGIERCVFLNDEDKCEIYPVRPTSCRLFPFWDSLKHRSFDELKSLCSGITRRISQT